MSSMKQLFSIQRSTHGDVGKVRCSWDPTGRFLVTCGANRRVHVWSRSGEKVHEIALRGSGPFLDASWDSAGETVALAQEKHSEVILWSVHTGEQQVIETSSAPTFISWSRVGALLVVGSQKGNLVLYNKQTKRMVPILGKHSKAITCGVWTPRQNYLALGSTDGTFTISDAGGDTTHQAKVRMPPTHACVVNIKSDKAGKKDEFVCFNLSGNTTYIFNATARKKQMELAFQKDYGPIVDMAAYGDSYLLVGCANGKMVVISTDEKEIGEEIHNWGDMDGKLTTFRASRTLNKLAVAIDNGVRIVDMTSIRGWKEDDSSRIEYSFDQGTPTSVEWTRDGQILTVATDAGYVFNYLTSIPVLSAASGVLFAHLRSLRSIRVMDVANVNKTADVETVVEPAFLGVGPTCLAAGMNNQVWFYHVNLVEDQKPSLLTEREYLGTVKQIRLNSHCVAVLCQGKCYLDKLYPPEDGGDARGTTKVLPSDSKESVTWIALTEQFLIFATDASVRWFFLEDWAECAEYRHSECAITRVFPDAFGTRAVLVDARQNAFVYSPVTDSKAPVPDWPKGARAVWEQTDECVFVAIESKLSRSLTTYVYTPDTVEGPVCEALTSKTPIPENLVVATVHNGHYWAQSSSGKVVSNQLATHSLLNSSAYKRGGQEKACLAQALALNRFKEACKIVSSYDAAREKERKQRVGAAGAGIAGGSAVELDEASRVMWGAIGQRALRALDIDTGVYVYTRLGNAAMVLALRKLQTSVEDLNLVKGYICMLFQQFDRAQRLFTLSKVRPVTALEMRRDLMQWDQALKLAQQLAPGETPAICREYGQQLEFKGDYDQALEMYRRALGQERGAPRGGRAAAAAAAHERICRAGIARMTLRTGSVQEGLSLARKSGDKEVIKACGQILESMSQYGEAAELYRMAGQLEKAASMYLRSKNFHKLEAIIGQISAPKLLGQYAKTMESQRRYEEAAKAYGRGGDNDNLIRLYLKRLDKPQKAFELVRQTRSTQGARMVANYCTANGNLELAIEFLLMAKLDSQAFERARSHGKMDVYARALGDNGTEEQYLRLAKYFESASDAASAARLYQRVGLYDKALRLFMQCGESEIDAAIGVVRAAGNTANVSHLGHQLHAYLSGELGDRKAKDPIYIYKLQMAVRDFAEASNTALLIAAQEQEIGSYKTAHSILFECASDLAKNNIPVPNELSRALQLLHSYIIVRKLVQRNRHLEAAKLLIRVAENISKFPAHVVQILTSCVVECRRGRLKQAAFKYAKKLMLPENRNRILPKLKKQIEKLVRRPPSQDDPVEMTPCPICFFKLPRSALDCANCKNLLPYCTVTGQHMIASDYARCRSCGFPALHSELASLANEGLMCFMCGKSPGAASEIVKLTKAEVKKLLTERPRGDGVAGQGGDEKSAT